ncbi:MAG: prenyltransferase/squalene oxidase repeat-containing protein [Erysipelotrichaceae bacterium]|nr:prenyltransferase/squalene oxidase repeat-containing protein [Erysipelotrichaceae bacterium]
MNREEIIEWLLEGDVSIQYQTHRDLLNSRPELVERIKERIAKEGWGLEFLIRQHPDGHWGRAFYQPKWTSTNYTLIDLKNLGIEGNPMILKAINDIADTCKGEDGGINGSLTIRQSDLCIDGMFLNYACYFKIDQEKIMSVVDFIINQQMDDGGFNCRLNRYGARHSSMHTTINVLEGIRECINQGYNYRR